MGFSFLFFLNIAFKLKSSINFRKDSNVILNNSITIKVYSNTFFLILLKKIDNYNSILLNEDTSTNKNE
jgi:hypothetical protein